MSANVKTVWVLTINTNRSLYLRTECMKPKGAVVFTCLSTFLCAVLQIKMFFLLIKSIQHTQGPCLLPFPAYVFFVLLTLVYLLLGGSVFRWARRASWRSRSRGTSSRKKISRNSRATGLTSKRQPSSGEDGGWCRSSLGPLRKVMHYCLCYGWCSQLSWVAIDDWRFSVLV